MNIHCPYCRYSFTLNRDYIIQALATETEKKHKFHAVECSKCRKVVKIPLKQMRRYAPREH